MAGGAGLQRREDGAERGAAPEARGGELRITAEAAPEPLRGIRPPGNREHDRENPNQNGITPLLLFVPGCFTWCVRVCFAGGVSLER